MSELSERVAREHHRAPWPDTVRGPVPYHLCAAGCEGVILEDDGDTRRHVAEVTEAAVRETIAADIDRARDALDPDDYSGGPAYLSGIRHGLTIATTTARGES